MFLKTAALRFIQEREARDEIEKDKYNHIIIFANITCIILFSGEKTAYLEGMRI
jgi:hypothetical protein